MTNRKVELSVEDGFEFAKFEALWQGRVEGVRMAAEMAIRQRVAEAAAKQKNVVPMEAKKEAV